MLELSTAITRVERRPAAYVLCPGSADYLYKGSSRDLVKRLEDHRAGRVSRTRNRRPLYLVYHEYCADYTAARKRENFLKSGKGRQFLKDHIHARVAERHTQRT